MNLSHSSMLLSHKMTEWQKGYPSTLPPCQAGRQVNFRHPESAARLRGHSLGGTEISRPAPCPAALSLMVCNMRLEQVVSVAGSQGAFASPTAPSAWARSTWNDHDLEPIPLLQ